MDDLLGYEYEGNNYFYHTDHQGSVVGISNGSGDVVIEYFYDVYGKPYVEVGTGTYVSLDSFTGSLYGNDRLYTGREYDSEIGLYYYRARYYDAETGRFISRDPIGYADDVNLYGYVGNSPVNYVDPLGLYKLHEFTKWLRNHGLTNNVGDPEDLITAENNSLALAKNSTLRKIGAVPIIVFELSPFADAKDSGMYLVDFRNNDWIENTVGGGFIFLGFLPGGDKAKVYKGQVSKKVREIFGKGNYKKGSSGGPGRGKGFSDKVKEQAREENGNKCVFCGTNTNNKKISNPSKSEIDHAIPKSKGGNNSLENAQNTCRTCNRKKGAQTTKDYIK